MAAAPKTGVMIWQGRSGRRYNIPVYQSDVIGADITWSQDGAPSATSTTFIVANEDMQLVDYAVPTGLTDTTGLKFMVNDSPVGQQITHALHVNTLATRPFPGMGVAAGRKIAFKQY